MLSAEFGPSPAAIKNREAFATSPFWRALFPTTVIDDEHALDEAQEFVRNGGGLMFLPTHPSLEDPIRIMGLLGQYSDLVTRNILMPTAIHRMGVARIAERFLEIEVVPLVTANTLKKYSYTPEEIEKHLMHFVERTVYMLKNGHVIGIAPQADQDYYLRPPKNKLLKHIIFYTDRAGVNNFGFIFAGIDIIGRNINRARNITPLRHKYVFKLSKFYTKEEAKKEAAKAGLSIDMWRHEQHKLVSPPAYVLKQSDLS